MPLIMLICNTNIFRDYKKHYVTISLIFRKWKSVFEACPVIQVMLHDNDTMEFSSLKVYIVKYRIVCT